MTMLWEHPAAEAPRARGTGKGAETETENATQAAGPPRPRVPPGRGSRGTRQEPSSQEQPRCPPQWQAASEEAARGSAAGSTQPRSATETGAWASSAWIQA